MSIKASSNEARKTIDFNDSYDFIGLITALNSSISDHINDVVKLFEYTNSPIDSDDEVLERAKVMDDLFDMARSENDITMIFANAIADRIEEFEENIELPYLSVTDRIVGLMDIKKITQGDLKSVAPQSVISDIINGKRKINIKQAKGFSEYFGLPVEMFIPGDV